LASHLPPTRRHVTTNVAAWLRAVLASICLLLPVAALAAPATYALDPVHTRVLFAVSHAGFSQAMGTVSGSTGTLQFDPDDWSSARLSVTVPLARLDMGDEKWTRAVGARGLLDVAAHPQATFTSTRIEPKDAQHANVCGTLALHGVEREVCLDVTFNQLKHHPLPPFRRTAGFSATTKLSRQAFGITAWPKVIGDEVELRIEAEAVRSHAAGEPDDNAAPADETAAPAPSTTSMPAPSTSLPAPSSMSLPAPSTTPAPAPTTTP
jgi:polyisoprenoid-binding protein YceI